MNSNQKNRIGDDKDLFCGPENLVTERSIHERLPKSRLCGHSRFRIISVSGNPLSGTTTGRCACTECGREYRFAKTGFLSLVHKWQRKIW